MTQLFFLCEDPYGQIISAALPLCSVTAHVSIVDVLARVQLSQTFLNDAGPATLAPNSNAQYRFPVPPGAAVCAFEAVFENGKVVTGIVEEKQKAAKDFKAAIAAGRQAALAIHERTDEFTIAIGNITPGSTVIVRLTYVVELADDGDTDQVRFVFPITIAPKYGGTRSTSVLESRPVNPILSITASVQVNQAVQAIACPSHPVEISIGSLHPRQDTENGPFEPKHAHVAFTSTTYLDQDFILTIKAAGLDAPRCTSETFQSPTHVTAPNIFTSPKSIGQPPLTTSIALTLAPRFSVPALSKQEYIFVADRSGSMVGFPIKALRSALQIVLRSLPPRGTFIQIVSFGSNFTSLFPNGSVEYNAESLAIASKHVEGMAADYGGTEIRAALESGAFKSRRKDVSTSVFVMTDGAVNDLAEVLQAVKTAVKDTPKSKALRVFALGIGHNVDAALVGGMVREGHGMAQFVSQNERMESKLVKMLVAAKGPAVRITRIDWMNTPPVSGWSKLRNSKSPFSVLSREWGRSIPELAPFEAIQQAPRNFPILYTGSRAVIYAILNDQACAKDSVTIHALSDLGDELELVVPVQSLAPFLTSTGAVPLIHTLAARNLLADLESKTHANEHDRTTKAKMVRLGLTYNLASKHTSFIAVGPESSYHQALDLPPPSHTTNRSSTRYHGHFASFSPPVSASLGHGGSSSSLSGSRGARPISPYDPTICESPSTPSRSTVTEMCARSADSESDDRDMSYGRERSAGMHQREPREALDPLTQLVCLQAFDGSFADIASVCETVGVEASTISSPLPGLEGVWATLLALTILQERFEEKNDEWSLVAEKARRFVRELLEEGGMSSEAVTAAIDAAIATFSDSI